MIGFDLALGSATLIAPRATLRFFGHEEPSPEVIAGFRRQSWVWLTFAAAPANAERGDEPPDWGGAGGAAGLVGARLATWDRDAGRPDLVVLAGLAAPGQSSIAVVLGHREHRDDRRVRRDGDPEADPAAAAAASVASPAWRISG